MEVTDWGLINYELAMQRQLDLVEAVYDGREEETLVLCSHPPVVTLGRGSSPGDLSGWSGEIQKVSRGGKATYHGPEQIVVYPIINLASAKRSSLLRRDIHGYLRALESSIVEALASIEIKAEVRESTLYNEQGKKLSQTGVWVGERKVASIGIAVKRWVTYHGIAINWGIDPLAFKGINPCGFSEKTMVCVEELTQRVADKIAFKCQLTETLLKNLS